MPNQQWAWEHLTIVDANCSVPRQLWVPRVCFQLAAPLVAFCMLMLSMTQFLGYAYGKTQSSSARLPLFATQDMPSGRDIAAIRVIHIVRSTGSYFHSLDSGSIEPLDLYESRQLARTCRLVCRDWARQLPLGDPKLTVVHGIVWYCAEDEWQALPKRYWAWVFQEIEWWMEPREPDYVYLRRRLVYKAWYPKVSIVKPV